METMIDDLFDPNRPEALVVNELVTMSFAEIGKGHSAYVFGDSDGQVVLKVFPPLNSGSAKELAFIKKNPVLAILDQASLRWENVRMAKRVRQGAKTLVAAFLSRSSVEKRESVSEKCIRGYEACIDKGLMECLPTRVISNCMSKLSVRGSDRIIHYLVKPTKIILQARFRDDDLAVTVLQKNCLKNGTHDECYELVEKAIEYQLMMWRMGLVCNDASFNILENSIVLPDGRLQLHDANNVRQSLESGLSFIREKQQDMHELFSRLDNGEYPTLLYDTNFSSVAETARKLYVLLPADRRDDLVMFFLKLARKTLREETFRKNWNG